MDAISTTSAASSTATQQLQYLRQQGYSQFLKQVADKLGVDPSKLQDALKAARSEGDKGSDFINAVAQQLGVQPDALQQAFQQAGQGTRVHHHHHHHHSGQSASTSSAEADQNLVAQGVVNSTNVNISA